MKKFKVVKDCYCPHKVTSLVAVSKENSILSVTEKNTWIQHINDKVIHLSEGEEYVQIDNIPPANIIFRTGKGSNARSIVMIDVLYNKLLYDNYIEEVK